MQQSDVKKLQFDIEIEVCQHIRLIKFNSVYMLVVRCSFLELKTALELIFITTKHDKMIFFKIKNQCAFDNTQSRV